MSLLRLGPVCALLLLGCSAKQTFVRNMNIPPARLVSKLPKECILRENGSTRAVFSSGYYGFNELWMMYFEAGHGWHRPLYLAQPIITNTPYAWTFKRDTLFVRTGTKTTSPVHYQVRKPFLLFAEYSQLAMSQILHDADGDGLSDFSEEVLWTDASNPDSDGDGIEDGQDPNPLAATPSRLTLHERLHTHVIETELRSLKTDQLVVVEQLSTKPLTYTRPHGLVLTMPADEVDEFVSEQGYGIPVLSATVKDTLKHYKVSFTHFIAPDYAWGFEALYGLNRKKTAWKRIKIYQEWGVVP